MIACLLFLVFAANLVLQGSFLPFFWPVPYHPDLLLILVVSLGILLGSKRGLILGLLAGLLQDIVFGPALGFFALSKAAAGYLAGKASEDTYKDQIFVSAVLILAATVFQELLLFLLTHLFLSVEPSWQYLTLPFLFKSLGNIAVLFLFYPVIFKVIRKKKLFAWNDFR